MMNPDDAHSGANPETEDNDPTDSNVETTTGDDHDIAEYVVTDAGIMAESTKDAGKPAASGPDAVVPPVAPTPFGALPLLEAQLGEALKIMRDFSAWIHHPGSEISECVHVSHAVSEMIKSSATLAKIAAQLQQGEPETRHRIIVEHASRRRAEQGSR